MKKYPVEVLTMITAFPFGTLLPPVTIAVVLVGLSCSVESPATRLPRLRRAERETERERERGRESQRERARERDHPGPSHVRALHLPAASVPLSLSKSMVVPVRLL